MTKIQRNLKEASTSAFLLGLEVINKITVPYRLEAFTILYCNAWELLLKYYLVTQGQKIYYRKRRNQARRSLSLRDCLGRVFTDVNDPHRLNIERCEELRDNAIHLFIPTVPSDVMGLLQAGVINYAKKLKEWTGEDLSEHVPLGMMALIFDLDPKIHSLDSAVIKRKMQADAIKWVKNFQTGIKATGATLGENQDQFSIPINFKLAIVKNPARADIVLGSGKEGVDAVLIPVPKNPDATHPYRQKEVIAELLKRCNPEPTPKPNSFDIRCIRIANRIDSKAEYFYKSRFGAPQYSVAFVDWITEQYQRDGAFFTKMRDRARPLLK